AIASGAAAVAAGPVATGPIASGPTVPSPIGPTTDRWWAAGLWLDADAFTPATPDGEALAHVHGLRHPANASSDSGLPPPSIHTGARLGRPDRRADVEAALAQSHRWAGSVVDEAVAAVAARTPERVRWWLAELHAAELRAATRTKSRPHQPHSAHPDTAPPGAGVDPYQDLFRVASFSILRTAAGAGDPAPDAATAT
ncbi:MAG TPA: hypothetical protein DEP66_02700, partial [Acidimicrobiaceae bacterium]|nr:hypothetical protein [Acidimicrobiaceae bacterium]